MFTIQNVKSAPIEICFFCVYLFFIRTSEVHLAGRSSLAQLSGGRRHQLSFALLYFLAQRGRRLEHFAGPWCDVQYVATIIRLVPSSLACTGIQYK